MKKILLGLLIMVLWIMVAGLRTAYACPVGDVCYTQWGTDDSDSCAASCYWDTAAGVCAHDSVKPCGIHNCTSEPNGCHTVDTVTGYDGNAGCCGDTAATCGLCSGNPGCCGSEGGGGGGGGGGCSWGPTITPAPCETATAGFVNGLWVKQTNNLGGGGLTAQGVYPIPPGTHGYYHGYEVNHWPEGWSYYGEIQRLPGICKDWMGTELRGYIEIDAPGTYHVRTDRENMMFNSWVSTTPGPGHPMSVQTSSHWNWPGDYYSSSQDNVDVTFPQAGWYHMQASVAIGEPDTTSLRIFFDGSGAGSLLYNGYSHVMFDHTAPCTPPVIDTPTPVPVDIRGWKVVEPGGATVAPINPIQVSLANPPMSSTNNFYSMIYSTTPYPTMGVVSRSVSVPAPPAGYTLMGHSMCFNDYSCHSIPPYPAPTPIQLVPGNAVTFDDFNAVNTNYVSGSHFVSLWWHYCLVQAAPTNVTATPGCSQATVAWTAAPGATQYDVYRSDGVKMVSNATSPATFAATCGVNRSYYVRATNGCGNYANSALASVTAACAPTAPTFTVAPRCQNNQIIVDWNDNSANETGFQIDRQPWSMPIQPISLPANTETYTDTNPPDPPAAIYYRVRSVISTNPSAPVDCRYSSWASSQQVTCPVYDSWFQCQGGDVAAASGPLEVNLAPTGNPFNPQAKLILPGEPVLAPPPLGHPGMAFGKGVGIASNLTSENVSVKQWLVNLPHGWGDIENTGGSGMIEKAENKYGLIKDRILSRGSAFPLPAGVTLTGPDLNNYISSALGAGNEHLPRLEYEFGGEFRVAILEVPSGGLNITSLNSLGTNKAIILVDSGDVMINSNILRTDTGNPATSGFLAIIAKGNVSLGNNVGADPLNPVDPFQWDIAAPTYPPHLSMVIYAEGSFSMVSIINQLKIDGGIVAMGGISMGRTTKGPYPAEFVHYNPGMMRILRDVGLRRKVVMEPVP